MALCAFVFVCVRVCLCTCLCAAVGQKNVALVKSIYAKDKSDFVLNTGSGTDTISSTITPDSPAHTDPRGFLHLSQTCFLYVFGCKAPFKVIILTAGLGLESCE